MTPRTGRVRAVRRLRNRAQRVAAGRFLAEGPQAVREALGSPGLVVEVYATSDASARHDELRRRADAAGVIWHETGDDVVDAISSTVHPQGLVAVCRVGDVSLDTALDITPVRQPRLVVVGVDVSDPGNAGTVVRCADAAGADAVVFCGNGVDPYNPKAVRASVGSLFHLPLALEADPAVAVAAVRAAGLQVLAADGAAALDLDGAEASGLLAAPTAWLLGNEAHGLGPAGLALADTAVAVPLYGRAESLNLATAAAVCLYASARVQRRMPTSGDA